MSWCHRLLSVIMVIGWLGSVAWGQDKIEINELKNSLEGPEAAVKQKIGQPVELPSKDAPAGTTKANKKKGKTKNTAETGSQGLFSRDSGKHATPILKTPAANLRPRSFIDKNKAAMAIESAASKNKLTDGEEDFKTRTTLGPHSFIEKTKALTTVEKGETKIKPTESGKNPKTQRGSMFSY